jgi:predicted DCC family thiol-disulfide oxidoreductase YuxK
MRNGWTGGQYSFVRGVAGFALLVHFALLVRPEPLAAVPAIAALFFALGWLDRVAALVMLGFFVLSDPGNFVAWMLLWHVFLPPAPFLSIAARGRIDPRGGWSISPAMFVAACVVLVIALVFGEPKWPAAVLLALLFLPRSIPRRAPETTDEVFYDGTCGLCHSGMRWLVAEDRTGTSFRYAPLLGDAFAAAFPDAKDLPDSVIVKTAGGMVLVRSDAAVHLLSRLGGLWRMFGIAFGALPRRVRDAMYDFVARVRYRIFGRKKDACPLMPADLRSRFTV